MWCLRYWKRRIQNNGRLYNCRSLVLQFKGFSRHKREKKRTFNYFWRKKWVWKLYIGETGHFNRKHWRPEFCTRRIKNYDKQLNWNTFMKGICVLTHSKSWTVSKIGIKLPRSYSSAESKVGLRINCGSHGWDYGIPSPKLTVTDNLQYVWRNSTQ